MTKTRLVIKKTIRIHFKHGYESTFMHFFNKSHDMDFFIDIHAHSTMMNGFMYGNIYEDSNRYERQAIFPKLLCSNADDFSMSNTSFNKDAVKAGTGRRLVKQKI